MSLRLGGGGEVARDKYLKKKEGTSIKKNRSSQKKKKIKLKECFPPADLIKNLRTLQVHPFKLWCRSRQLAGCHEVGFQFSNYRELPRTAQSGFLGVAALCWPSQCQREALLLLYLDLLLLSLFLLMFTIHPVWAVFAFLPNHVFPSLIIHLLHASFPEQCHLAQLLWRVRTSMVSRPCSSGRTRTLILLTLLWTVCTTLTEVVNCTLKPPSGLSNTFSLYHYQWLINAQDLSSS